MALDEALARVRDAAYEPVGIPLEEAEALPPGGGVSDLLLADRRAREY